ncbi:hypothetical protein PHMEG_00020709, partial [Phytophthora megakarya]
GRPSLDIFNRVPNVLKSSVQKAAVNLGSRSETIKLGRPWCRYTISRKIAADCTAVTETATGARCTILLKRSTKTRTPVRP